MSKARRNGAILLPVVEIDDVLAALQSAKQSPNLVGHQRQLLDNAIAELGEARRKANGRKAFVPRTTLRRVLRCMGMTQDWFTNLLNAL